MAFGFRFSAFGFPNRGRHRGLALYATTLLISLLVTGAGLSLVTLQMIHRRLQRGILLNTQASLSAGAGMDYVFWSFASDPNWRSNWNAGQTYDLSSLGMGTLSAVLTDSDSNLRNNDTDTATATATSSVSAILAGQTTTARHRLRFTASPGVSPALAYTVFSRDTVAFSASVSIAAPIRGHGNITDDLSAVISSGASFETVAPGVISANLIPAHYASAAITAPTPDLTFYTSQATPVTATATSGGRFNFMKVNLTPTSNSTGAAINSKGVYWINAGGKEVRMEYVHVKGTLIITNVATQVYMDKACLFESAGFGYPVLLIDAGSNPVNIAFPSGDVLNESGDSLDYNGDGDQADSISPGITGVVWCNSSSVALGSSAYDFKGCLIGNAISVSGGVRLKYDSALSTTLMPGFTDGKMHLVRGSVTELPLDP
ncbi:MAG TPA: hypothetical protein VGM03_02050 [Phycisphaerae bacterium]